MEEKKHCKWYNDEFCTNGDSPCVADYCPCVEYPELCKCREEDLAEEKKMTDDTEIDVGMIVKALENASNGFGCGIVGNLYELTLDLIQRLQSENERLSLIASVLDKGVAVEIVNMQETIDTQKAEIERLTEELKYYRGELQ